MSATQREISVEALEKAEVCSLYVVEVSVGMKKWEQLKCQWKLSFRGVGRYVFELFDIARLAVSLLLPVFMLS